MGFNDLDGSMAAEAPEETRPPDADMDDHGLRFINDEWNGSIANGQSFTLQWNESIEDGDGDLRLFKISYPEDGAVSFELVSNLTGVFLAYLTLGLTKCLQRVWMVARVCGRRKT